MNLNNEDRDIRNYVAQQHISHDFVLLQVFNKLANHPSLAVSHPFLPGRSWHMILVSFAVVGVIWMLDGGSISIEVEASRARCQFRYQLIYLARVYLSLFSIVFLGSTKYLY
jgi:hypothetical protein